MIVGENISEKDGKIVSLENELTKVHLEVKRLREMSGHYQSMYISMAADVTDAMQYLNNMRYTAALQKLDFALKAGEEAYLRVADDGEPLH